MAHEIGHNLGMDHDFIDPNNGKRFSKSGQPCTGVKGTMDYDANNGANYHNEAKWSACSNEDWKADYNKNGGRSGYCLLSGNPLKVSSSGQPNSVSVRFWLNYLAQIFGQNTFGFIFLFRYLAETSYFGQN